jgi:hypothetical protein
MRFFTTVYSLPVLHNLSKQDKKKALRACQLKPFKSWKVWLSFLIFVLAQLFSKITFYSVFFVLCSFGYLASLPQLLFLRYFFDLAFFLIALSLFMKIYNPVISECINKYLTEQKEAGSTSYNTTLR